MKISKEEACSFLIAYQGLSGSGQRLSTDNQTGERLQEEHERNTRGTREEHKMRLRDSCVQPILSSK